MSTIIIYLWHSGCCNTLDDASGGICVLNKIEDVNLNVFNMVARIINQKY